MIIEQLELLCKMNGEKISNVLRNINVSPSNAQRWRNGEKMNIETLVKLANYFNVTTDYLLGRAEQPTKIEQNVSHNTLNDQSIGINNVQSIENNLTKELINEFEKLSFKNKSYVMNIIAELNEPIDQNFKMVASPSRPEPPKISQKNIEEVKRLMQEIEEEKL